MQKCIEQLLKLKSVKIASFCGAILLAVDQITKHIIVNYIPYKAGFYVTDFFNIVHVRNKGITFGMLTDVLPPNFFGFLSVIVVIFMAFWAYKNKNLAFFITIIIFGAIGNIIDRFVYGYVIDFLDFHIFGFHWPAFNIADCAIVFGNISILLILLCYHDDSENINMNEND